MDLSLYWLEILQSRDDLNYHPTTSGKSSTWKEMEGDSGLGLSQKFSGVGQWLSESKHLPHKHEDLSSDTKKLHKPIQSSLSVIPTSPQQGGRWGQENSLEACRLSRMSSP